MKSYIYVVHNQHFSVYKYHITLSYHIYTVGSQHNGQYLYHIKLYYLIYYHIYHTCSGFIEGIMAPGMLPICRLARLYYIALIEPEKRLNRALIERYLSLNRAFKSRAHTHMLPAFSLTHIEYFCFRMTIYFAWGGGGGWGGG
jgi:hypothetical protein